MSKEIKELGKETGVLEELFFCQLLDRVGFNFYPGLTGEREGTIAIL